MRRTGAHSAVAIVLVWAGCGSAADAGPSTAVSAVDALECSGRAPFSRHKGSYDDGLATVQSGPEEAFDDYVEASGIGFDAPLDGYRVESRDEDRALLSYDVGERTKVSVVLADGIRDFNDDVGWGVVAWAQCDPAELPAEVTDDLNIGVWEDASGRRLPVKRVRSYQGPEHCSWTDITFLLIGPDWYVRDPARQFPELLRGTFDGDATLPEEATSTGWRRDGRELWLADNAAYLVAVDDRRDVERWPAAREPILCA